MECFFNYIVPIFNKEDILPLILEGLNKCASSSSRIYTVIDGCTDRTEQIVDDFAKATGRDVVKMHMPNVHMLRSVNAALRVVEKGFSVVMQDDIIMQDENFEKKILNLYKKMGDRLGVISLRLAANIELTPFFSRPLTRSFLPMIREIDFIMNVNDNLPYCAANYENFYFRVAAINGPNVIPWVVRNKIGLLDEALAPYGFDDHEYCLRAMKAGFINGLYALKFKSDVSWGGTRRNKTFSEEAYRIHLRNKKYIWDKHGKYVIWLKSMENILSKPEPIDTLDNIPNCCEVLT